MEESMESEIRMTWGELWAEFSATDASIHHPWTSPNIPGPIPKKRALINF
jgi:hypothetical protein